LLPRSVAAFATTEAGTFHHSRRRRRLLQRRRGFATLASGVCYHRSAAALRAADNGATCWPAAALATMAMALCYKRRAALATIAMALCYKQRAPVATMVNVLCYKRRRRLLLWVCGLANHDGQRCCHGCGALLRPDLAGVGRRACDRTSPELDGVQGSHRDGVGGNLRENTGPSGCFFSLGEGCEFSPYTWWPGGHMSNGGGGGSGF
jgi:hypothetical protein